MKYLPELISERSKWQIYLNRNDFISHSTQSFRKRLKVAQLVAQVRVDYLRADGLVAKKVIGLQPGCTHNLLTAGFPHTKLGRVSEGGRVSDFFWGERGRLNTS